MESDCLLFSELKSKCVKKITIKKPAELKNYGKLQELEHENNGRKGLRF